MFLDFFEVILMNYTTRFHTIGTEALFINWSEAAVAHTFLEPVCGLEAVESSIRNRIGRVNTRNRIAHGYPVMLSLIKRRFDNAIASFGLSSVRMMT